jgi:hypothetical protein
LTPTEARHTLLCGDGRIYGRRAARELADGRVCGRSPSGELADGEEKWFENLTK